MLLRRIKLSERVCMVVVLSMRTICFLYVFFCRCDRDAESFVVGCFKRVFLSTDLAATSR